MRLRQRRALSPATAGLLSGLLAAATLLSSAAMGQTKPTMALLVVPTGPQLDDAASRIRLSSREVLERIGRFQLIPASDALDGENARARTLRAQEAMAAMNAARNAYNELDTVRALAETERAIRGFSEADLTAHLRELGTAWILKAASLVANGDNKAAEAEIDRLLAVDPSAQFSPNFFPPELMAYAERSRKTVMAAGETLEVRTTPAGAEVHIDGRFRGVSPLTVKGLVAGDHYVTAMAPGYALAQRKARPGVVELNLRTAPGFPRYQAAVDRIARSPTGEARDAAAREYGQFIGVDQVLVLIVEAAVGATQGRLIGMRLDPKDGHNLAYHTERMPVERAAERAEEFIAALLGSDDARRGGPLTHYEEQGPAGLTRTAGWALLGLSALAAGTGAVLGISAGGTHAEWLSTPQIRPESKTLASTGRQQAALADVSFIVAAVTAAGGGLLTFTRVLGDGAGDGTAAPHAVPPRTSSPAPEAGATPVSPSPVPPPAVESASPADTAAQAKPASGEATDETKPTSGTEKTKKKSAVEKKERKKRRASERSPQDDR
jgi:hypothetical protein